MTTSQDMREEHPMLSPEVPEFSPSTTGVDESSEKSTTSSDNIMLLPAGKPNNLEEEITQACNSIFSVVWEEVMYMYFLLGQEWVILRFVQNLIALEFLTSNQSLGTHQTMLLAHVG